MSKVEQSAQSSTALVILEIEPMKPMRRFFKTIPVEISRIELKRADDGSTSAALYAADFGDQRSQHRALIGQMEPGRYILTSLYVRIENIEGKLPLCDHDMFDARAGEAIYVGHYRMQGTLERLKDNFELATTDVQSLQGVTVPLMSHPLLNHWETMSINDLVAMTCGDASP